jgi:MtN3 and saliva related transmembrane protein
MNDEWKKTSSFIHHCRLHPSSFQNMGETFLTEAIGWASSFILVLTIARQIYKQWQEGTSEGVSKWLFIGQMAASSGFTLYSWLVHNWVFVVTNSLMLANGLAGLFIVLHHRRREQREGGDLKTERA